MSNYKEFHKKYWDQLAQLDSLRSVLDPNDVDGGKNNELSEIHHKKLNSVFSKLFGKKLDSVIDFGCGIGRNVDFLSQYFEHYLGIDQSEKMLAKARHNYPKRHFINSNDFNHKLINEADVFFAFWVFQHIVSDNDLSMILEKARNVISDNGYLIFCERSSRVKNEMGKDSNYILHRSPKNYVDIASKAGYVKVLIERLDYKKPTGFNKFFKKNRNGENIYVFKKI